MNLRQLLAIGAALGAFATAIPAEAGQTLDAIRARGHLQCGVNTGLAGFSAPDQAGNWHGLDVDVCRAVAAALFGNGDAVRFTPLTTQQRFTALQSGEVDILSRNTTLTLTRDASLGLTFAPVTFFDGQGFLVPRALNVSHASELNGATICVQPGTTTEVNLADYFRAHNMTFQPVVIDRVEEATAAFFAGRCDVFTSDTSQLASIRSTMAPNPENYVVLPEVISKEPLAPAVRQGDDEFADIVRWTVYALIEAEERGVTQANAEQMRTESQDPNIRRLLGATTGMGELLHLDEAWAYNAIHAVGNYGEIFNRNVGAGTPFNLARGLNDLWTRGGLMYAMPIR